MLDSSTLPLFVVASLILLVSPGPAILYVVAESLGRGRRAGLLASLGLTAGNLVHVAAAALGISALLAASAPAFSALKLAGAGYLVWIGARQIAHHRRRALPAAPDAGPATRPPSSEGGGTWAPFRRGLVVNTLNPKIAIFFLAFFPQFLDPTRGDTTAQILGLGLVFAFLTLVVDATYAVAAASAGVVARRSRFGRGGRLTRAAGYTPGVLMVGLGVAAALVPVDARD